MRNEEEGRRLVDGQSYSWNITYILVSTQGRICQSRNRLQSHIPPTIAVAVRSALSAVATSCWPSLTYVAATVIYLSTASDSLVDFLKRFISRPSDDWYQGQNVSPPPQRIRSQELGFVWRCNCSHRLGLSTGTVQAAPVRRFYLVAYTDADDLRRACGYRRTTVLASKSQSRDLLRRGRRHESRTLSAARRSWISVLTLSPSTQNLAGRCQ